MLKLIIALILALSVVACTNWLQSVPGVQLGLCKFKECCHSNDGTGYILYEKGCDNLLDDLNNKVFGQPLIIKPIFKSLKAHMTNENPSRPLVMYFSGWTGTGKTYVARLIAKNLFKEGMKSNFVKYISSSYHFPMKIEGDTEIAENRQRLRDMIRETVKNCERSLIILDELDKLPAGVVDALQPMLDYVDDIDGQRYNKAIFIFLSNTGAHKLNLLSYKMFQDGKERKDLSSKDIEEILIQDAYGEEGGLRHSNLLRRYSIGVFVPFLPLERSHVKACIKAEIENSHVIPDDLEQLVEDIADEVAYFPNDTEIYSKSGCKGIHDKVVNHIGPDPQDKFINTRREL
jgi:ATP-dependent Clp protease ATP-binding subunit ClpA